MCHRGGRTGLFDWSFDLLLMDVAPPGALFLVCVGIRQERILGKVLATIDSDGWPTSRVFRYWKPFQFRAKCGS